MAFGNLANYQTVKERKDLFAADHSAGVILALPREVDETRAIFTVGIWKDRAQMCVGADRLAAAIRAGTNLTDVQALLVMAPDSIGTAFEANWMTGASKTSWTENCEESAIGRALDNLGYHGSGKCSREEVLKAKEAEAVLDAEDPFGDKEPPIAYQQALPIVATLRGKRGVKELRQFFGHCSMAGMTWNDVEVYAESKGVALGLPLSLVNCVKLRDLIKQDGREE